jgi:hypothetical protein
MPMVDVDVDDACRTLLHRWSRREESLPRHNGGADTAAHLCLRADGDTSTLVASAAVWLAHSAPTGRAQLAVAQGIPHGLISGRLTMAIGCSPFLKLYGPEAITFARLVASRMAESVDARQCPTRSQG